MIIYLRLIIWNFRNTFVCSIGVTSNEIYQCSGQAIRPVDPTVFDRIRIGFHRNPTSFIKNRSDPTRFLSDSFGSESDPDFIGIQRSAMKSDQIRHGFHRAPSNSDEIRTGFRSKGIRLKPCRIRGRPRPPR